MIFSLRFMYCDEVEIDELTVLPTLHAAKKYLALPLSRACLQFLKDNLSPTNVLDVLRVIRM